MANRDRPIDMSRRAFFGEFLLKAVDHLRTTREELHGRPQMRLDDLDNYPDEVMQAVTPVFNPNIEYQLLETRLRVRYRETAEFIDLLALADGDYAILMLFDRGYSLWEIAQRAAEDAAMDATMAYSRVRFLFLALASRAACYPMQSLVGTGVGGD